MSQYFERGIPSSYLRHAGFCLHNPLLLRLLTLLRISGKISKGSLGCHFAFETLKDLALHLQGTTFELGAAAPPPPCTKVTPHIRLYFVRAWGDPTRYISIQRDTSKLMYHHPWRGPRREAGRTRGGRGGAARGAASMLFFSMIDSVSPTCGDTHDTSQPRDKSTLRTSTPLPPGPAHSARSV
jgi:hypothetical protein